MRTRKTFMRTRLHVWVADTSCSPVGKQKVATQQPSNAPSSGWVQPDISRPAEGGQGQRRGCPFLFRILGINASAVFQSSARFIRAVLCCAEIRFISQSEGFDFCDAEAYIDTAITRFSFLLDLHRWGLYFCGSMVCMRVMSGRFWRFSVTLMEILLGKSVIVGLNGQDKREVLEELVNCLEVGDKITDRDKVLDAVLLREEIMSTGIGHGIAIPHGKSEYVTELGGVLGIKRQGVDFDALDGKQTYIFFLLVSPLDVSGPHIKALARISRLLKGEDFRQKLIAAVDKDDAIAIIEEEEKKY